MNTKRDYKSFDFILAIMVIALTMLGLVLIASVTDYDTQGVSSMLKGQIVWVATGIIIMFVFAFIDFRFIAKFYVTYYIINIGLLVISLIYGLVFKLPHSRSIYFPGGVGSIQPSEFNKIFMIIFLARFIDNNKEKINTFKMLAYVVGFTIVPVLLIAIQPSYSASLVTVFIMATMIFAAKINSKFIIVGGSIVIPISILSYFDAIRENPIFIDKILFSYHIERIKAFHNPIIDSKEYWQNQKALEAIGSGQLNGKGLFNHVVIVPEATNDFIFTIMGEEFGFIGCLILLTVILIVIFRCFIIANKSDVFYGKLIAIAVAGMMAFQVFVNVGVNTYLIPNTGMVFPFISSGGSSMWVNLACIGLVLSIGMTKKKSMFGD